MKKWLKLSWPVLAMTLFAFQSSFLSEQLKFQRVRKASEEKKPQLESTLKNKGLKLSDFQMMLIAYKESDELELYVKSKNDKAYSKLKAYKICAKSGTLGPKNKKGDAQVPEGFYHIDRFNASSNFYLSLGLNYPNAADRKRSKAANLGGDIFIHGNCVTIGCMPMTDDKIKEIYLCAVHAKNNGQKNIPVYVFPFNMKEQNMLFYKEKFKNNKELIQFWENLKKGYDAFQADKQELKFLVGGSGEYVFIRGN
ncbi:MAG: L,D-transpeptidase family protein [Bacteroidia bacterium]